ncbi:MAG: hypothetical protein HY365_00345 [Candidatus Aenigmarchaeota archaeon]|nr:hypothetical protein [Candidatus Aenigmarchaeota archaeon]
MKIKFASVIAVYAMVLLGNIFYVFIPGASLFALDEFRIYAFAIFAPLVPVAIAASGAPIAKHHETAMQAIATTAIIISVFATIIYGLPAIL